jgi:hypothetical protein
MQSWFRTGLFGLCLLVRLLLVWGVSQLTRRGLQVAAALALVPAIAWVYLFVSGARPTGPETFGDPIWWNDWRPVHAGLYLAFSWQAWQASPTAWRWLAADVAVGLVAYLRHRRVFG